ncbi:hypothetical protein GCM10009801_72460 [Streptomyces albiaxialis]|uniref:Uncharacterized protein n=1 Tax=Streptomyces albiaxialis TaxID=329523 RepID=A0ABN2WWU3_9ACTN
MSERVTPPPSRGGDRDPALLGHWSSAPFDLGAMESSDLAFLADGRGWSVLASASGSLSVTRFGWSCPAEGVLELRERWYAEGDWSVESGTLEAVRESGPATGTLRTAYALDGEALRFAEPVEFASAYARGSREAAAEQDPSYGFAPDESALNGGYS